eukprot:m.465259 g.465259  ORF g.465259 m.465259 type:complete len:1036 (+) comp24064_c0_seq1:293-3400(+)
MPAHWYCIVPEDESPAHVQSSTQTSPKRRDPGTEMASRASVKRSSGADDEDETEVCATTMDDALAGMWDGCVTEVSLSAENITNSQALQLGKGFEHAFMLHALYIHDCRLTADQVEAMGLGLSRSASLEVLVMDDNQLGDAEAGIIATVLKACTSMQSLDLSNNRIGDSGARRIADVLEHSPSLQRLDLGDNMIGDEGAIALAAALEHNRALGELHLHCNQIGDVGAKSIGGALKHNQTLHTLSVWGDTNTLGDSGAAALFASLEHNHSLNSLDLSYCEIKTLGVEFLWTQTLQVCEVSTEGVTWPPQSIMNEGRPSVYRFLAEAKVQSAPLTRNRLMFVGSGGVGKTTLKMALQLRGPQAPETLERIRDSMIQTIEVKWTEPDLREWIDGTLAEDRGFYALCPEATGLAGKSWLRLTPIDVKRIFGSSGTITATKVVSRMNLMLKFLRGEPAEQSETVASAGTWSLRTMVESLTRSTASLQPSPTPAPEASHIDVAPYAVLPNIPHSWTEGVHLDPQWEGYTVWDFAGHMELYPSEHLFLSGCETAVYVVVVNGQSGKPVECVRHLQRWLNLIQSGRTDRTNKHHVRIVVTHTDRLLEGRQAKLLQEVHDSACSDFGTLFDFGDRCFAPNYGTGGSDVDALRAEVVRLRDQVGTQRGLPARDHAVVDRVLAKAVESARWPVVPRATLCNRDDGERAIGMLEDLGFLRMTGKFAILDPVMWLSAVMAELAHPYHGINCQYQPPLPKDATASARRAHHIKGILVEPACAFQIVNIRSKVVDYGQEKKAMELLERFDLCFSPHQDGKYVFPALLPRVTAPPVWLAHSFNSLMSCRRYSCTREHDLIPPVLVTLLMKRVVAMAVNRDGMLMFFGRGTVIVSCGSRSFVGIYLSDDDRTLDTFGVGVDRLDLLSEVSMLLVSIVHEHCPGLALSKNRLAKLYDVDGTAGSGLPHPLLGPCRLDLLTTHIRKHRLPITPEWLSEEYARGLAKVPWWTQRRADKRRPAENWTDKTVDNSLVYLLTDVHLVLEALADSRPFF